MPGKIERPAGSLNPGEPAFLAAGKVRRPHGVRGEFLLEVYTDFPERLQPGKAIHLGESHALYTIRRRREHNDGLLLGLEGIDSPEEAGRFRNQILYVKPSDTPDLDEGEFYFHELLDLAVFDDTGRMLGTLSEIIETGANDVYVVITPEKTEILLPAIPEVIKEVDLASRRMTVHLLAGLVEEEGEAPRKSRKRDG